MKHSQTANTLSTCVTLMCWFTGMYVESGFALLWQATFKSPRILFSYSVICLFILTFFLYRILIPCFILPAADDISFYTLWSLKCLYFLLLFALFPSHATFSPFYSLCHIVKPLFSFICPSLFIPPLHPSTESPRYRKLLHSERCTGCMTSDI